MIKNILLFSALFVSAIGAGAQKSSYSARAQQYVAKYKDYALAEQRRSGVPAAITLGQGILETEAGNSELATMANNHFGIKCRKEWLGETFAHDDDAPQECFRKYPSAAQSYKDHSDYLKCSKRYQSCFAKDMTDYAAWAKELRKCGYATNPKYAHVLIKIIEDFHLQDYTYAALGRQDRPLLIASAASPVDVVMIAEKATPGEVVPEHDTPPSAGDDKPVYGEVMHKDGLKGFYAHKGDVLLEYAIQYKVRYARLLEMNSLPDAPLAADMFVYLEKGNRITQIISRDASMPAVAYAAPAKEPASKEEPAVATPTQAASPVVALAAPAPAAEKAMPAAPISNTVQRDVTVPAAAPAEKPAAVVATNPVAKEEEPQDEFSRLKARLDKVVYAPMEKKPSPVSTAAPASVTAKPATPVLLAAATGGKVFHTVKNGETAFGIAKQYGISIKELNAMNSLNFEAIRIGQKLRVK